MRYLNQLEPDALIKNFIHYPPQDFKTQILSDTTIVFSAKFNLLTTFDPNLLHAIKKIPFYKYWNKWLQPYTCFVGTTVSEYMLFPEKECANSWVVNLKLTLKDRYAFLIIKDIPMTSPLLDEKSNNRAIEIIAAAKKNGFIIVEGQALAWVPINFESIDDYLANLSKSSRKNIRRKLKSEASLNTNIIPTGNEYFINDVVINEFYQLYLNVFHQSDIHFDLITRDFLKALLQDANNNGVVMIYCIDGKILGYNISFIMNNKLIDKYVGFQYPLARDYNLYFISWFVNLRYALEHKLSHYVAGWTDPDVKKSLGAEFTFTYHAVHIRNPIVRTLLKPFKPLFERDHQFSNEKQQLHEQEL